MLSSKSENPIFRELVNDRLTLRASDTSRNQNQIRGTVAASVSPHGPPMGSAELL
jgi:hypothetical protein